MHKEVLSEKIIQQELQIETTMRYERLIIWNIAEAVEQLGLSYNVDMKHRTTLLENPLAVSNKIRNPFNRELHS